VELKFVVANNDRVSGVVTAAVANNHTPALSQVIYNFALGFIAPLGTNYYNICHFNRSPALRDDLPVAADRRAA
jgi:hypothetical protein